MPSSNENQQAYIFVDLPDEEEPVIAGKLVIDGKEGRFVYGKSYLARKEAFALDPINLPLSEVPYKIIGNGGVPAAFLDAGPDNWGKRLMTALHTKPPRNRLEELLATRGAGVGALSFSYSRTRPKSPPDLQPLDRLTELQDSVSELVLSGRLTPELMRMLDPGSSMGGARPKTLVKDEQGLIWIAKFNRSDDLFDQSKAEQICYLMQRDCGIHTADTQLISVSDRSVLLVRRFDVCDQHKRHFISAHALSYRPKARASDVGFLYSYPALTDYLQKIGSDTKGDKVELFRRMVFNVLVGNTDDHLRNHGFLKDTQSDNYRLSPAYDVVPQPTNLGLQAIGLGSDGRQSTIRNVLSSIGRFGLSRDQGVEIIDQIKDVVGRWMLYADSVALSPADRKILSQAFSGPEKHE